MVIYQPKWIFGARNLLNWSTEQKTQLRTADCCFVWELRTIQTGRAINRRKSTNFSHPSNLPPFNSHNLSSPRFVKFPMKSKSKSLLIITSMIYSFPFESLSFVFRFHLSVLKLHSVYKWGEGNINRGRQGIIWIQNLFYHICGLRFYW